MYAQGQRDLAAVVQVVFENVPQDPPAREQLVGPRMGVGTTAGSL